MQLPAKCVEIILNPSEMISNSIEIVLNANDIVWTSCEIAWNYIAETLWSSVKITLNALLFQCASVEHSTTQSFNVILE